MSSIDVNRSGAMPVVDRAGWFRDARYGLFIHWGPYAAISRGEQSLFREQRDPAAYERDACRWDPQGYNARAWARAAVAGGFRYAVLTARHHDGYCLWDSQLTNYTSQRQAPGRDFVGEYVEAFRSAGLRVGLYYSLADWRVPAYWRAAADDPAAWAVFRRYIHGQVEELLTGYGPIDVLWFDGAWPHPAADWDSHGLLQMIRRLQPEILVNNRLDSDSPFDEPAGAVEAAGQSRVLGDFGTPEHHITAEAHRPWESCQVTTSRLWGYAGGEHWRPPWQLMDMLCEAASKGGNLLLNVGPDGDGRLPSPFLESTSLIGAWLKRNGEAIYRTQAADVTQFVTQGYQTQRDNVLYLILRFWHEGLGEVRLPHLATPILDARWLDTDQPLQVRREPHAWVIRTPPRDVPPPGYPVIRVTCDGPPQSTAAGRQRLWSGDPATHLPWVGRRPEPPWHVGSSQP